jgi:GntR family transcriptional regulator/GntR family frlABCD operon transcriptional regulator
VEDLKLKTVVIRPAEIIPWPESFPFLLKEQQQSERCIYFERLRTLKGEKILFEKTYLPDWSIPRFCSHNMRDRSLFDILRKKYAIEVKGGVQKIKAVKADREISSILSIARNSPLLYMERILDTNRPDFTFYSLLYSNTGRYFLQEEF